VAEDPLARLAWERLTAALGDAGVVDASHAEALAALADTWADYQRVRAEMRDLGYRTLIPRTRVGLDGSTTEELVVNPLRRTTLELAKELRAWLAEFGLTPITVSKVARRETAEPDDDPLAAFLAPATRAGQIRRVK
jgi:P27 family predicted phage terminase small subunit